MVNKIQLQKPLARSGKEFDNVEQRLTTQLNIMRIVMKGKGTAATCAAGLSLIKLLLSQLASAKCRPNCFLLSADSILCKT